MSCHGRLLAVSTAVVVLQIIKMEGILPESLEFSPHLSSLC